MAKTSVALERVISELRHSESEAREASVIGENVRDEDAEAVKLLHLATTTWNASSDPTVQGFREKRDSVITKLVSTCMNFARDVLAQVGSAPTDLFSRVAKLENSDVFKRLLAATNPDNSKDGDRSGKSVFS